MEHHEQLVDDFIADLGLPRGVDVDTIMQAAGSLYGPEFRDEWDRALYDEHRLYEIIYRDRWSTIALGVGLREARFRAQLEWMTNLYLGLDKRRNTAPHKIMDIGAGSGATAAYFAGLGSAVLALDPHPSSRIAALAVAGETPLRVEQAGLENSLDYIAEWDPDIIVVQDVLTCVDIEHICAGASRDSCLDSVRNPEMINSHLFDLIGTAASTQAEIWLLDHQMCPEIWCSIAGHARDVGLGMAVIETLTEEMGHHESRTSYSVSLVPASDGLPDEGLLAALLQ